MFGECHAHLFMNGYHYGKAVELHKGHICDSELQKWLWEYQKRQVTFIRDGGDNLGVSARVKDLAGDYGIEYRTPIFAIHKKGHYGGIVGKAFTDMREYEGLVKQAREEGADFIKIMVSGLVDFSQFRMMTSTPLEKEEIREMVHIAHEEGMAVMVHGNGSPTVQYAAEAGADSLEHGRYIGEEDLWALKEAGTVWVPTLATVKNLLGCERYPENVVKKIYRVDVDNVRLGRKMGVQMALGSDAGAYLVPHGQGIEDEYKAFQEIFGPSPELDVYLERGEEEIQKRFCRN